MDTHLKKAIEHVGYTILTDEVDGKNQSRYYHLILARENKRYFAKINKNERVLEEMRNSHLLSRLTTDSHPFWFVSPEEVIELQHTSRHCMAVYPYIELPPVSKESNTFEDFEVPEVDTDLFLDTVLELIDYVRAQDRMVTYKDADVHKSTQDICASIARVIQPDAYRGLDILIYLFSQCKLLSRRELAFGDMQFQNMFWDPSTKRLALIDGEWLRNTVAYYDYALVVESMWVVQNRQNLAKKMFTKMVARVDKPAIFLPYFRFCSLWIRCIGSIDLHDETSMKRITSFIDWVLDECVLEANTVSAQ